MPLSDGIYKVTNVSTSTVVTVGAVSGAKVTGSKDTAGLNQQWNLTSKGDDTYFLVAVDPDLNASVKPPSFGGQEVISNNSPTKWTILSAGAGKYSVGIAANNLVWQLTSTNDGTAVTLGPNAGGDAQKWKFEPLQ